LLVPLSALGKGGESLQDRSCYLNVTALFWKAESGTAMNKSLLKRIYRIILRFHLVMFVSSVILIASGYVLYQSSFSSYEITAQSKTGITIGQYPYHNWTISSFDLQLKPSTKTLYLEFGLIYEAKDNYSIVLTLPYRIVSNGTFKTPPDEGKWIYSNALSGSIVLVTLNTNRTQGSTEVSANFTLQDPIADKVFEMHYIALGFGSSRTQDVDKEWQNLRNSTVPFAHLGIEPEISLHISIPSSAMITSLNKEILDWNSDGSSEQVLEFHMTNFVPFFLQYSDPTDRHNIENNLFLSGILLGSGISLSVTGVGDIIEEGIRLQERQGRKPD
jgi:hypothetical protein